MSLVRYSLTYFILMFGTIFVWFILGHHIVNIFVLFFGVFASADINGVISNVILGTNLMFIGLLVVWTIWFVYAVHSSEYEQSFQIRR